MARKVKWTKIAWRDLESIAGYIARDSPYYAAAFIREVREASRTLVSLAERGRVVPEFNRQDIHELFIRNYRMIYQVTKNTVYIIGFIHGSRDLMTFWNREFRYR